ncbi:MAG: 4-hydroxythreonine-4-phosphate dehydrogenase PdxA [Gammaproteobacteria bacterium]
MIPTVGITLGDPCGIGAELVARLLSDRSVTEGARVLLIGDRWLLERGLQQAGVELDVPAVSALGHTLLEPGIPTLLEHETVKPEEVRMGEALEAGGRSVLTGLKHALDLARDGTIDAITFAPLNKHAMHLAGYGFADELHWFAQELGHQGHFCELNVLEDLWTSRVTSHVALKDVAELIDEDGIVDAVHLVNSSLKAAGVDRPRIGVAALNPHAGDGGIFGREEIDIIRPAVERTRAEQIHVDGPFPSDTIFLKARDGEYDAIVTMYHDQGQIAMKLMGFDRGVTVQGGLPVPITTPAHGTAFDIAGKGVANPDAMKNAFRIARRMGANRRAS